MLEVLEHAAMSSKRQRSNPKPEGMLHAQTPMLNGALVLEICLGFRV
jgi:hypothetical protein